MQVGMAGGEVWKVGSEVPSGHAAEVGSLWRLHQGLGSGEPQECDHDLRGVDQPSSASLTPGSSPPPRLRRKRSGPGHSGKECTRVATDDVASP